LVFSPFSNFNLIKNVRDVKIDLNHFLLALKTEEGHRVITFGAIPTNNKLVKQVHILQMG